MTSRLIKMAIRCMVLFSESSCISLVHINSVSRKVIEQIRQKYQRNCLQYIPPLIENRLMMCR